MRNFVKCRKYGHAKLANFVYFCITCGSVLPIYILLYNARKWVTKNIQNSPTSHGRIIGVRAKNFWGADKLFQLKLPDSWVQIFRLFTNFSKNCPNFGHNLIKICPIFLDTNYSGGTTPLSAPRLIRLWAILSVLYNTSQPNMAFLLILVSSRYALFIVKIKNLSEGQVVHSNRIFNIYIIRDIYYFIFTLRYAIDSFLRVF